MGKPFLATFSRIIVANFLSSDMDPEELPNFNVDTWGDISDDELVKQVNRIEENTEGKLKPRFVALQEDELQ